MQIKNIKLNNFRNYESLYIEFDKNLNILIGNNAQGKTNLMEAIYICSIGKSFRTQNSSEMIKIGADSANIQVNAESEYINKKISIILTSNGKKIIKKDNKYIKRTADLLSNIIVVIFSPEDLRIIKDSPEKRRNFINKEISQIRPQYYDSIKKYNELIKQKNSILKDKKDDFHMLDIYDRQLSHYGTEIIKIRRSFIKTLNIYSGKVQKNISSGKENLEIVYNSTLGNEKITEEDFYNKLLENRKKDIFRGNSSIGPHRDDLEFYINGEDVKKFGSQGQQRTTALSLKMAEIDIVKDVIGEKPILLLDDVMSEMDTSRQKFLIKELNDIQIFITSTEIPDILKKEIKKEKIFVVEKGNIKKNQSR